MINSFERIRFLFLLVSCFLSPFLSDAQVFRVSGRLVDQHEKAIPPSNIFLFNKADSTTVKQVTYSDDGGLFKFNSLKAGDYLIKIHTIGYFQKALTFEIQNENLDLNKIYLRESIQNLNEVSITAKSIQRFADKTVYRLSSKDIDSKTSALFALTIIPKLTIDINDEPRTIDGKQVKILLNGIDATGADLAIIPPQDIIRIDYYENPPARYALLGVGVVLNVITRQKTTGGSVAANLMNCGTTTFGNNTVGLKYNFGNTQIGFRYKLAYRDFSKNKTDEFLAYNFGGIQYTKDKIGENVPWKILSQDVNLNVLNQKIKDYVFDASFTLNLFGNYPNAKQTIDQLLPTPSILYGTTLTDDKQIKPTLDVYYDKLIGEDKNISFNMVGTYFRSNYYNQYQELTAMADTSFFSSTRILGNKYSIISDLVYSAPIKRNSLSIGVRSMNTWSNQDVTVTDTERLTSNTNDLYAYAEMKGQLSPKFSYVGSLGVSYNTSASKELNQHYHSFYLRPIVNLSYDWSKESNTRLSYQVNTQNPTLAQLSENPVLLDDHLAYSGNSQLKPYYTHQLKFSYNYTRDKFYLSTEESFDYSKNPIMPCFTSSPNYLLQTYDNFESATDYMFSFDLQWYPFKTKWLQVKLYADVCRAQNKGAGFYSSLNSYHLAPSVTIALNKWSLNAFYTPTSKSLDGQLIQTGEGLGYVEFNYRFNKNLIATLGCRDPFYSSSMLSTGHQTTQSALVSQRTSSVVANSANRIYLTVVYNLSFGSKMNETKRRLYNSDNDSGILKK